MELYSITKGNFNLDKTKESYRHENNLRFHVKDDNGKFYEFNINSWNKKTINLSMNLLSSVKRPRIRTEKFENLYNLCADFNRLSAANREKNLKST